MEPSSTTFSACRKLDRETTRARHHTKTCWSVVVTWQDKLLTTSRNTQGKWIFPMNWQRTQSFFPLNWTAHWCGIIGLQWLLEDPPWRCSSIPVRTATHLWNPTVFLGTSVPPTVSMASGECHHHFWSLLEGPFDFLFKLLGKLIYEN